MKELACSKPEYVKLRNKIIYDSNEIIRLVLSCILLFSLTACTAPVFGVPAVVATEVAPRAINGKGLAEDGVDAATGKDCRVIEGAIRKNRKFCETRNSPETQKDFKGAEGLLEDDNQKTH